MYMCTYSTQMLYACVRGWMEMCACYISDVGYEWVGCSQYQEHKMASPLFSLFSC